MRQGYRSAALLVLLTALAVLGLAAGASASGLAAPSCDTGLATSGCPYVQSLSYGGTGCPQGSVGSSFGNDRRTFTLIFDSFVASAGPGIPATEGRKNCQVNVNTTGYEADTGPQQLTLDFRGYVQIPAAAGAVSSFIAYVQGEVDQLGSGSLDFTGPLSRDYLLRRIVVVPAGAPGSVQPVNLNAQVRLFGGGPAQITTDSIDARIGPADPVALIDQLRGDVAAAGLDHGLANDLDNKLRRAANKLGDGKTKDACKKLDDFVKKITGEAGKKNPKIDAADAEAWTAAAAQIDAVVGCP